MKQPPPQQHPEPPRAIGAAGLGAAVFNMVVGAGIFVLPAALAREVGAAAPFAYLACVVTVGAVVICFAAASSRVAASGGPYAFVHAALGPGAGFLAGVLVWLGSVLAAAGIGAALIDALKEFFPVLDGALPRAAGLIVLYAALAAVNLRGGASGSRLSGVLTLAKLAPIAVLLGVGAFHVQARNFSLAAPDPKAFGRAVLLATFAFQGMEGALGVSGEVRRPERNVPLGLLGAMGVIACLYLAIQVVVQGVLGPALAHSSSPLTDAMRAAAPTLAPLIAVGAAVSMLGYLSGDTLSAPRVIYAFARDGFLPRGLGSVVGPARAPAAAIILHVVVAAVLAITGAFVQLAVLSTLAIACVYLVGCVSAVILQRRGIALAGPPLTLRGLEVAATVGVVGVAWIASHATRQEALAGAIALAVSLVWYLLVRRRRLAMVAPAA